MKSVQSALIAAALLATAAPAAAQSIQELVGKYPMTVTAKSGSDCGRDDEDIRFVIHKIAGSRLTFGFDGEEQEVAEWDAATKSFRFEQAVAGDAGQSGVLDGRFTRQADAVRLDLKIETAGCTGTMVGLRPAPPITVTATEPAAPAGTATAASEDPAAAQPAAAAAADPAGGMSATQMAMFGGGGVALLGLGVALGWFLNRRRDAAPPPKAEEPAASPPPADDADA